MQIRIDRTLPAAAACVALLAFAPATGDAARTRGAHRQPATAGIPVIPITLSSNHPAAGGATIDPPTCVTPSGFEVTCYSPELIRQAYDFPGGDFPGGRHALTGRGETIVLVEAYGNPTVDSDLASFDAEWNLPAPPAFEVVGPNGSGDPTDPDVQEWQRETSLDVEWAHALAPGARIVLVVAASDDDLVMNAAEADALPHYPNAIVSHSFGSPETDDVPGNTALHKVFVGAQLLGDTLVAGAGDFGATDGTDAAMASYPASDPLVTSVGGTEGLPYPDGLWRHRRYGREQVWNEGDVLDLATGGAPSTLFDAPSWQQPFSRSSDRTTPDVAFDAAVDGGVLVVTSGQVSLMGGTSLGSPAWAAIFALANESRGRRSLGFANPSLYALAADRRSYRQDFHDITVGNNALDSPIGFDATPGYDLATGLGTPDVANLLGDLGRSYGGPGGDPGEPHGHGGGPGEPNGPGGGPGGPNGPHGDHGRRPGR